MVSHVILHIFVVQQFILRRFNQVTGGFDIADKLHIAVIDLYFF